MPNLSQISALLEKLTDDQLMQEMQRPSGMAPLMAVMDEVRRRSALRGGKPRGYAEGGLIAFDPESRDAYLRAAAAGVPGARITSVHRTPERQRQLIAQGLPAAQNSRHTSTRAIDFVAPGVSRADVRAAMGNVPYEDLIFHPENNSWHMEMPANWDVGPNDPKPQPGSPTAESPKMSDRPTAEFYDVADLPGDFKASGNMALELLGVGKPKTLEEEHAAALALLPSMDPAYAAYVKESEEARANAKKQNRGRALMEMGLAMMAAQTPNFMEAVAQGGQAGLSARDRIREQEMALMQAVHQGKLAQGQADFARAKGALDFSGMSLNRDAGLRQAGLGIAGDMVGRVVGAQNAGATGALQERMQKDAQAFQAAQAAEELASRERVAEITAGGRNARFADPGAVYADFLGQFGKRVGERVIGPDGKMKYYTMEDADRDARAATNSVLSYGGPAPAPAPPAQAGAAQRQRPPLASILGD